MRPGGVEACHDVLGDHHVDAQAEQEQAGTHAYRNFVCWYANTDNIVFPASTATLPGADNRHMAGVPHVAMAFHPKVMADTLKLL